MLLALIAAAIADAPTDCGTERPVVPDASLVDLNPGSPTYGGYENHDGAYDVGRVHLFFGD